MNKFIYLPVEAAKELPEKNEKYYTDIGEAWFHTLGKYWTINSGTANPKFWLRSIPLSELEGEIESLIETYFKEWDSDIGEFIRPTALQKQRNQACAEAIVNLLKQVK